MSGAGEPRLGVDRGDERKKESRCLVGEVGQRSKRTGESGTSTKSFAISKRTVFDALKRVIANRGAAGIDAESITEFEQNLVNNLYA